MSEQIKAAIAKYRALRDKKKIIQERHKEELAPYNEGMMKLEAALLKRMQEDGVDSIKTSDGTVYLSRTLKASVEDWGAFREYAEQNDLWDMMEKRVSKAAVEEFVESEGSAPPGIAISTEVNARFRK